MSANDEARRAAAGPVSIRDTLPEGQSIRVLLHGLMVGCFNQSGDFEVGAFTEDPTHKLQLNVWERSGVRNKLIYSSNSDGGLRKDSAIRLKVHRPRRGFEQASAFQVGHEFDRHSDKAHRHDFRWVVDYEGSELHGEIVSKVGTNLQPRFYLESGVVFTLVRSIPLLKVREGGAHTRLFGRTAQVQAAHIYLDSAASPEPPAELIINGKKLTFDHGKQYDVAFRNDCFPDCPTGTVIDTTQLNQTFVPPAGQSYFTFITGLEGPSAEKLMDEEVKDIDLGELDEIFQNLSSPVADGKVNSLFTRAFPCGGAYFSSGSLDLPAANPALGRKAGSKYRVKA